METQLKQILGGSDSQNSHMPIQLFCRAAHSASDPMHAACLYNNDIPLPMCTVNSLLLLNLR